VVFVNPYTNPERDEEKLKDLAKKRFPIKYDPHVFSLAGAAYRDLVENQVNQSIIITGESGSGKTSMGRLAIKYLTMASSSKRG